MGDNNIICYKLEDINKIIAVLNNIPVSGKNSIDGMFFVFKTLTNGFVKEDYAKKGGTND